MKFLHIWVKLRQENAKSDKGDKVIKGMISDPKRQSVPILWLSSHTYIHTFYIHTFIDAP